MIFLEKLLHKKKNPYIFVRCVLCHHCIITCRHGFNCKRNYYYKVKQINLLFNF